MVFCSEDDVSKRPKDKASIVSPAVPFPMQADFVSPEPEEVLEPGAVLATQAPVGTEHPGDVETFQLRPEDIERWNPRQHAFEGEVLFYEPGFKLIYERAQNLTPVVARFVGALVLGWLVGLFLREIQWSVIIALSFVGVIELFRWKTGRYEATRWEWNWQREVL